MSAIHLKDENLLEIIDSTKGKLILVDFFAIWCGPCQMITPVIEDLAKQYEGKIDVYKVDIDQHQDLAQKYGVQSIPTIMLFKDGKEVGKQTGFAGIDGYKEMIDSNL
jgi:thioredoxin 1